jgi:hypothetical protein
MRSVRERSARGLYGDALTRGARAPKLIAHLEVEAQKTTAFIPVLSKSQVARIGYGDVAEVDTQFFRTTRKDPRHGHALHADKSRQIHVAQPHGHVTHDPLAF